MTTFTNKLPYQDTFDEMKPHPGFDMRVVCAKNVPPRDPQFEYIIEMGRYVIDELFAHKNAKPVVREPHVYLCFPERHMSVHEQRWLGTALEKAGYERADIITSSVFIVQSASAVAVIEDPKYLLDTESDEWWFGHGK